MIRRRLLPLLVWLCTTVLAMAQDAARLPLVGVLQVINIEPSATMLRGALAALGHIDGKTFRLDFRPPPGFPSWQQRLFGKSQA
jgi:hypothetical protein